MWFESYLGVRGLGVDTILGHLGETHQHIITRNAVLVEAGDYSKDMQRYLAHRSSTIVSAVNTSSCETLTSIIHLVEAVVCLGADITNLDSREGLVVLQRAERDHKDMCTIVFAVDEQSSLDHSVS